MISRTKKKKNLMHVWFEFFKTVLCSQKQREQVWFLVLFCFEKHKHAHVLLKLFLLSKFSVLCVIYNFQNQKKKKKKLKGMFGSCFFKIFYILKNKKIIKNMENTFGFQRHQNGVLYVFKKRSKK